MPPGRPKTIEELEEEIQMLRRTSTTNAGINQMYYSYKNQLELAIKALKRISGMGGSAAVEAGKALNLINSL